MPATHQYLLQSKIYKILKVSLLGLASYCNENSLIAINLNAFNFSNTLNDVLSIFITKITKILTPPALDILDFSFLMHKRRMR